MKGSQTDKRGGGYPPEFTQPLFITVTKNQSLLIYIAIKILELSNLYLTMDIIGI
jgi:hypothetical protein